MEHLCSHWKKRLKNANTGENPGVGSIPLKSIAIFKQEQRAVELLIREGSRSRSESTGPIALSEDTWI